MGLAQLKKTKLDTAPGTPRPIKWTRLRSWLLTWEIYALVLVAAFLRFYRIDTLGFGYDQARLYRLAHDAVTYGLLPGSSIDASIHILNPPFSVYVYMLPAAFSPDPIWAAVTAGLFTTVAVLLTYLFTRRYYGRLAGIFAGLTYVTAAMPLYWATFIWQPTLMAPFVVLFMFALFKGVVERRKGWLFPALLLSGILYQLHETSALLVAPLLLALVLAPGTLRWRDLVFGLISLVIIFFPYLLTEYSIKFADLHTIYRLSRVHAVIDGEAIRYYLGFFTPFVQPETSYSLVHKLAPILTWLKYIVPLIVLGGFVTAGLLLIRLKEGATLIGKPEESQRSIARLRSWWIQLRASPERCGFLVLLIWQIVPVLILSRHTVVLQSYYFFMLLPGPFILIGLFLFRFIGWLRQPGLRWWSMRYGIYVLTSLVIVMQLVSSSAFVYDYTSGNVDEQSYQPYHYHNDLASLKDALATADQVAQQRHLNRVYIITDFDTRDSMRYLAEQMHTPTTLYEDSYCLLLPNPAAGPALFLVGPYDDLTNALISQFAIATLIGQPARSGGLPFKLYEVMPATERPSSNEAFVHDLQPLSLQAQRYNYKHISWLVTQWSILQSESTAMRTSYSYALTAHMNSSNAQVRKSTCTFTTLRAGDQLTVLFDLPVDESVPTSVTIEAQSFMTTPYNPSIGPIHLETDLNNTGKMTALQTAEGRRDITLLVS